VRELAARVNGFEDHLRGLEETVDVMRQESQAAPVSQELSATQMLDLGLRDLREPMAQLESMASWTPKLQRLWVSLVASAVVAALAVVFVR
jgi:hypothetical protein